MQEAEVLERARRGDADAERALFDAHVDRVYRLAYRMTGDEEAALECAQDVFVRAFDKLDSFRGDSAFSTWLHSITARVVIDRIRKQQRQRKREVAVPDVREVEPAAPSGDPGLKVVLARAIDGLSDILKAVFVLHDIEGFKHPEIAAMLGVPEGTSRARLSRAREQLRAVLSPQQAEDWT